MLVLRLCGLAGECSDDWLEASVGMLDDFEKAIGVRKIPCSTYEAV